MPPELVKAHQALDKAVDLCYLPQPFINETKRIEFLFELYDKLTSGMFGEKNEKLIPYKEVTHIEKVSLLTNYHIIRKVDTVRVITTLIG